MRNTILGEERVKIGEARPDLLDCCQSHARDIKVLDNAGFLNESAMGPLPWQE